MGRVLWMPDMLRAWGVDPVLDPGWATRGSAYFEPRGVVDHHTGGIGDIGIVRRGRPDLPGPLAHIYLGRSKVYVIASGKANHAGAGGWRGLSGNSRVLGIEGESRGTGEWTAFQRHAWPRVNAALCDGLRRYHGVAHPELNVMDHREWAPRRKVDPVGYGRGELRALGARLLAAGSAKTSPAPVAPTATQEDDMNWCAKGDRATGWVRSWQILLNTVRRERGDMAVATPALLPNLPEDDDYGPLTVAYTRNTLAFFGLPTDGERAGTREVALLLWALSDARRDGQRGPVGPVGLTGPMGAPGAVDPAEVHAAVQASLAHARLTFA